MTRVLRLISSNMPVFDSSTMRFTPGALRSLRSQRIAWGVENGPFDADFASPQGHFFALLRARVRNLMNHPGYVLAVRWRHRSIDVKTHCVLEAVESLPDRASKTVNQAIGRGV